MNSAQLSTKYQSIWTVPSDAAKAATTDSSNGDTVGIATASIPSLQNSLGQMSNQSVNSADVVIVGGGFAGLSAAYHLLRADPNKRVVLLESQTIGYGASTRNSGMLTPGVGQSLAALVKRYGSQAARQMYVTSLDAVEYLAELTRQNRMDVGLRSNGQLILARGRAGRSRLASQAKLMRDLALPFSTLDDSQLAQKLNVQQHAPGTGPAALHLPIAGVLDPARLVHGLAQAVVAQGGILLERSEVSSIDSTGVQLSDGRRIRAKQTVVATNGYNTSLNAQQGRLIPMHLRMIATRPLAAEQLRILGWRSREGAIDSRRVFNYFRLTDDDRLLFGGGLPRYRWQGNTSDLNSIQDTQRLIAEMRQLFPCLSDIEIEQTWTGVIAFSIDTLPTIGTVSSCSNVFHMDGWCGHGIALSVYAGRWIVDLVNGRAPGKHPWFRNQAPRIPTELGRWCGTRIGSWATKLIDRVA